MHIKHLEQIIAMANRDINELTPLTQQKLKLVLKEVGDVIFITEWYRSQSRQNELYAKWRTAPGSIVTYTLNSNHTGRTAVDIWFRWNVLYPHWNDKRWKQVASVFKKYWFNRGGDWTKRKDRPHFEDNWKPLSSKDIIMLFYEKLWRDNYESIEKNKRMFKDPDAFIERVKNYSADDTISEMTFLIAILAEKTWQK